MGRAETRAPNPAVATVPGRPLDLRLAGAAAGAWAATYALPFGPERLAWVIAACALVPFAPVLLLRRRWSMVVATALVGVAAGASITGLHLRTRDTGPLADAVSRRASGSVTLRITDDPRRLTHSAPGRSAVLVHARVTSIRASGRAVSVGGPVLVIASNTQWTTLLPGQRVRTSGRWGAARPGDLSAGVLSARGPPRDVERPPLLQRVAGSVRADLRRAVAPLPAAERGLLPGLVDGDVSALLPSTTEDFRTTGMTHLVAVSGSNCAIVLGAVMLIARRLKAGPRVTALCGALALAAFVIVARPSPSVLRAAVMGGVAVLALLNGRLRAALPALCGAVLLLVLIDPALAGSAGFALSVLATLALVVLAPGLRDRLARRLPRFVADAVAVPAAAEIACAPVVAAISGQVSLVAIPANLLAAPAVAPATLLGVAVAVLAPMWTPAATAVAWIAAVPVWWLAQVAGHGAVLPAAALPWRSGAWGAATLVAVLLAGAGVFSVRRLRRPAGAVLTGVAVVLASIHLVAPGWPPPGWVMVACDVGQGDGLVLRVAAETAVVVDTGPDPVPMDHCLRRLHVRAIPLLVLTHLHADHVGGLAGVLRHRSVGAIAVGASRLPADQWSQVRRTAAAARVPIVEARRGVHCTIGELTLSVLGPAPPFDGAHAEPNTGSLVALAQIRGRRILLAGDATASAEGPLLADRAALRADVLKVAHHGSADQDRAFLGAVRPSLAVISVGDGNSYGQPATGTLSALTAAGVQITRTDRDGDIAVSIGSAGRISVTARGSPSRGP